MKIITLKNVDKIDWKRYDMTLAQAIDLIREVGSLRVTACAVFID